MVQTQVRTATNICFRFLGAFVLGVFLVASSSFASPYILSYGGRLTQSDGQPLAGPVTIGVRFYRSQSNNDPVAGVNLADFTNVTLAEGIFQLKLTLTPAEFHLVFNGTDETWVQITDVTHSKVYPRQSFSAVPYALKVPVDGESISYNVDGELTLAASGGAAGKFLKFDSPGVLVWETIPGGGDMLTTNNLSDLTNVSAARTSLGLGSMATKSAVASADITDGTVTGTDIASGTITDANINASAAISSSKISGLGGLATKSTVGSSDITDGSVTGTDIADGTITDSDINATAGISHLKISGLGAAASKAVGTGAGDVAAGNHTHTMSAVTDAGALATKNTIGAGDIDNGSISLAKLSATICSANQILKMNSAGTALTCGVDAGATSVAETKSANYTIVAADAGKVFMASAGLTFTLPLASTVGAGFQVFVKNTSTSAVSIALSGADQLNGTTTQHQLIGTGAFADLFSDGSQWYSKGQSFFYPGFRYYRFHITSLDGAAAATLMMTEIQLKINGSVVTNAMTSDTVGTIGVYQPTVSSPASTPYVLFDGGEEFPSPWFSANGYSAVAPYDGDTAVTIDFKTFGARITGLRVKGSTPTLSGPGYSPDAWYVEGSGDGLNWATIPGSTRTGVNTYNVYYDYNF